MKTRDRFAVTLSTKGVAGALLLSVLMLGLATHAAAQEGKTALTPDEAKAKQAYAIGVSAYIWGYPMVVGQKSRDAMTKGGDAPVTPEEFNKSGKLFAPVNQMANAWGVLGPKFSAVQSANSDTQYSVTWYDVSKEPYVLHIPDAKGVFTPTSLPMPGPTTFTMPAPGPWVHKSRIMRSWHRAGPANCRRKVTRILIVPDAAPAFIAGRMFVANERRCRCG